MGDYNIHTHTHTHTHTHSYDVIIYGWYGEFDPRENNGEISARELSTSPPSPIQYVEYNQELFELVIESNEFNPLTFRVEFVPNPETTTTTTTKEPTPNGGLSMEVILGVAVGGALGGLLILLIIVIVCVFGRRRDKPKKKKRRRYTFV